MPLRREDRWEEILIWEGQWVIPCEVGTRIWEVAWLMESLKERVWSGKGQEMGTVYSVGGPPPSRAMEVEVHIQTGGVPRVRTEFF